MASLSRRGRGGIVSATTAIDPGVDPSAIVLGSRRATDRWFCWEQPDREGFAIAALGSVREIVSRGESRFADLAAGCAAVTGELEVVGEQELPAGAGAIFSGGFAFSPDGGGEAQWASLPPALLVLPEVSLWRRDGRAFLTINASLGPGDDPAACRDRAERRLAGLEPASLPPGDPAPATGAIVRGARSPGDYERAVAAATARIAAGEAEKIVLAREVIVEAERAYDPGLVFASIRALFPECFCFCCGTPEAAFVGASPELLIRRSGAVAAALGLAGSTRRSADPAVDDHLGESLLQSEKNRSEHAIVVRRIERSLSPFSVWVDVEREPQVARVANIQHLATPIRAHLAEAHSAVDLAGRLHPTPAVGGEPSDRALAAIPELEELDRGWYAGPVGWMDSAEDGEFCVALRSALLRDRRAHLYAGAGIVAGSDPAAELAETELKLDAMMPLLAG